ncbi:MAG: hypothetical protein D6785_00700, partial [Planctomycetota bacterium]
MDPKKRKLPPSLQKKKGPSGLSKPSNHAPQKKKVVGSMSQSSDSFAAIRSKQASPDKKQVSSLQRKKGSKKQLLMGPVKPLPLGTVLAESLNLTFSNFIHYLALLFISFAPVALLAVFGVTSLRISPVVMGWGKFILILLVFFAIFLTAFSFFYSSLIYSVFQHVRKRNPSLGEALQKGWARMGKVFSVGLFLFIIFFFLAIAVRFISSPVLLVIARMGSDVLFMGAQFLQTLLIWFLLTPYFVAFPVTIVENRDGFVSIQRSSQLTRGNRLRIFVLFIITTLISKA